MDVGSPETIFGALIYTFWIQLAKLCFYCDCITGLVTIHFDIMMFIRNNKVFAFVQHCDIIYCTVLGLKEES